MPCCDHCASAQNQFGPKRAARDLARYRRRGPDGTTRQILEDVRGSGLHGAHLLDVGAGIGVLHHELLGGAVERVTHVEASSAYVEVAREEDARRGHGDRVTYVMGDAVDLAGALPAATVVTLDRVICCYPDWEGLVRATASRADRLYAFSIPRARWFMAVALWLANLLLRIRRSGFRVFIHPIDAIDELLAGMGFRRRRLRRTVAWQVALYARDAAGEHAREMRGDSKPA